MKERIRTIRSMFSSKIFLLIALIVFDQISQTIPSDSIQYFRDLIKLDFVYFVWAMLDKELRLELGILTLGSIAANYLILLDYINDTNYIYDWYLFIMTQIFYACIFTIGYHILLNIQKMRTSTI